MSSLCLTEKGLISRKSVKASIVPNKSKGIRFKLKNSNTWVKAEISNLFSTQRNTVLANDGVCICLTEHFLAACALLRISNIDVILSEPELPFGDGSAAFWIDFLTKLTIPDSSFDNSIKKIMQEFIVEDSEDKSRFIKIIPNEKFEIEYKMDWDHPALGKQNYIWSVTDDKYEIAKARTFSSEAENKALGLSGWVLGFDENGFNKELYANNEPARHKALDLLGDLMLSGFIPLNINMKIISNKGGHELNSKAAKKIKEIFSE